MDLKRAIRDLVIGRQRYIPLYSEYKQVILSGQYALLGIIACSVLCVIDLIEGNLSVVFVFVSLILCLITSLLLHRCGRHCTAHFFLLIPVNLAAYLLTSSESAETWGYIHFISIALGGFIVFGYRQRWYAVMFAIFTFLLVALSYFPGYSFLPYRFYSEELMLYLKLINFSMASVVCVAGVSLLIRLNYKNSVKLLESYKLLTKTNAELDRFVYSTSHDLRAPLTSILGLINIAEISNDFNEVRKYHQMMKDRIMSLDKFIKDITDYSRNNRLTVEREQVDLTKLVREVWDMLRYTPEAQQIDFHLDIPDNLMVETDLNRLKTVLLNLVSNAIRYHDLRKADRFVKLQCQMNGESFKIKVEDNGQGIDPSFHTKIFDMFFRANDNSKGSGLGLYIVKETINKLSGSIQLESSPGVGSTFTIKIPY